LVPGFPNFYFLKELSNIFMNVLNYFQKFS